MKAQFKPGVSRYGYPRWPVMLLSGQSCASGIALLECSGEGMLVYLRQREGAPCVGTEVLACVSMDESGAGAEVSGTVTWVSDAERVQGDDVVRIRFAEQSLDGMAEAYGNEWSN